MTILQSPSSSLSGFFSSRGVGGVQSRVKIKKQNVNRRTVYSGSFLPITVWQTVISCLCGKSLILEKQNMSSLSLGPAAISVCSRQEMLNVMIS